MTRTSSKLIHDKVIVGINVLTSKKQQRIPNGRIVSNIVFQSFLEFVDVLTRVHGNVKLEVQYHDRILAPRTVSDSHACQLAVTDSGDFVVGSES